MEKVWIDGNWYDGNISAETDDGFVQGDFEVENYHVPNKIKKMRIFGHCVDIFKDVKLDSDRKTYQSNDIYLAIPNLKGNTIIDGKKYFVERG